jgi:prepilin-type N-terminal cleavage/methylation domain-containing protein
VPSPPRTSLGFTLTEMLVAISVLTLLVLLVTQLVRSAASTTTLGHKRNDADSQARSLFERLALDLAQLVKRTDVSYYLKNTGTPMPGNDLVGFYSAVQGYHPTTPSPVSVVAYRVNSNSSNPGAHNCLERMGKGLDWNGTSAASVPFVFLPLTIHETWPCVASSSAYDDADPAKRTYEIIGPQIFRFEYYYLEKTTGALVTYPVAWTSLSTVAINDASALVVAIAVIDPKSKVLLSNSQITTLGESLPDYAPGLGPGQLLARWQSALGGITNMPRSAISQVRLYERSFPISDQ